MSSEDQIAYMDEAIAALDKEIAALQSQNERLVEALNWAKAQIEGLARRSFAGPKEAQEWIDGCQALKAAQSLLTEIQKAKVKQC